uniref:Bro-N domain-containing protein n=1 Tax=viral metagenome TaxID=1070528 RepID=A0A6C0I2U4_9ZZZZ
MDIVKAFNANDLHTEIIIKGTVTDPLFRASDVGAILDINNIRMSITDFDESEKRAVSTTDSTGRMQEVTFLTEKGLYKVLFRSRKPIAQKFQNWVCEVVKEIRLTGIYKMQNEINKAIEEKNEAIEVKNKIREKTLIEHFPSNVQCVYYGTIDNKSEKGERLIKFGNSNCLKNRIYSHKKTYQNFRLINAFKVENKLQIENAIKEHPLFIERQRTIMIKKHNFTELINMEGTSESVVDESIREIIRTVEYSPEKYLKLLEENRELKKQLCYASTLGLGPTPDYISSLNKEIKELKEENIKIIKKYHTRVSDPPLTPSNSIQGKGSEGTACPLNKNITRDNIDGKYHVEGNKFEKIRGTREEVWSGTAYQTTGELKKIDLELNKHGKIVSKIKLITARLTNNFIIKRVD